MAKFTLSDDKTDASQVTLHVGDGKDKGRKRLHLAGVAEKDRAALSIISTSKAVTPSRPIPYDMDAGVWTVDLTAEQKGEGEVQAKVGGAVVARAAFKVLEKLKLPAASAEAGMLVRLFLAETASPESGKAVTWTPEDAKKSMQWMKRVLRNRLDNNPQQFMAKGAKTFKDIVTAKDAGKVQFQGFSKYPPATAGIESRVADAFKVANDDDDPRQAAYAQFVQAALDVAGAPEVSDPCGGDNFLSGWMTVGSSTGDEQKKFQVLMDNQFFMMKRKK